MATIQAWGLGRILAIIGIILVIILIVIGQMTFLPIGLLFLLAFAAILL
jgi:hypothetical protein